MSRSRSSHAQSARTPMQLPMDRGVHNRIELMSQHLQSLFGGKKVHFKMSTLRQRTAKQVQPTTLKFQETPFPWSRFPSMRNPQLPPTKRNGVRNPSPSRSSTIPRYTLNEKDPRQHPQPRRGRGVTLVFLGSRAKQAAIDRPSPPSSLAAIRQSHMRENIQST